MSVLTIVGGQYGSEGKGVIASELAGMVDIAVRVGAPNAGHSIKHEGRVWKMRSIPCAWINPATVLVLGPGAIIDANVLRREITEIEGAGYSIRDRLFIDERATILTPEDHDNDAGNVAAIGSTGEGIGPARIRKLQRNSDEWVYPRDALGLDLHVVDTSRIIGSMPDITNQWVMLEGTQGFGLSLTHGSWPYVTTTDATAVQLWNDSGVIPDPRQSVVIQVMRTYPIRVAGNSGPLRGELTWADISERMGRPIEERTTVTNKVRRIGEWDWDLAAKATRMNRPSGIALTFADYLDPTVEGTTSWFDLTPLVTDFIDEIEERLNVPVICVGTGGPDWSVAYRPAYSTLRYWVAGFR